MADGATLDPGASIVRLGGIPLKGRAPGQSVAIAYRTNTFSLVVGVDGESVWIKSGDRSATITLTFMQSSESNDILSAFHEADRNTDGGVVLPFYYRAGRSIYKAASCRVIKMADAAWSDGHEAVQWTLETGRLNGFVGGVGKTPRFEGTLT